jgi:hypothetical protein
MPTAVTMQATPDAADRPIVLVTSASGAQARGVARQLLRRGRFAVRALTRSPDGAAARELRALGAELARGDLADANSLRAAVAGCYGAFGVADFREGAGGALQRAIDLADAASDAGVGHLVFSTLSAGEPDVPHVDLTARLESYARGLSLPATFVHVACDVDDTCGVVATIFERRAELLGRTFYVVRDDRPPAAYAAAMARATGRPIGYAPVSRELFASFAAPRAVGQANMFELHRTASPTGRATPCTAASRPSTSGASSGNS